MKQDYKLDILIVDDEPLALRRMKALCSRMDNINRIDVANEGQQALDLLAQQCPDVVLLDIDMPDISGMKIAYRCKNSDQCLGKNPEIIFTTAHSRYAVEAFRIDATDYLLKPVKEALLKEALDRVLQHKRREQINQPKASQPLTNDHWLWVQDGNAAVQIRSADIGWIIAERDYMRLCLPDRTYLVHEPMRSLLERLPPDLFVRIHRSAAVRRDFLRDIRRKGRRKYIVVENNIELTIGPSHLEAVMRATNR
ncbi:LytTR family DNA-binding domain-containing protein [Parasphingorhabdus sp. JC815]|uniref:LytR/AlgR family response regulator transcription factor n=1 Tax=Parasphingorhabdus sp. JC815 TaxID=3232140 RepID=UPI0034583BDF